jgi:hypothetical protein
VDQMWVYGIRLIVERVAGPSSFSRVNFQNVDERLRSSRIPITEKAERCKRFLEQYTNITNSCAGIRSPDPDMSDSSSLPEEEIISQLRAMSGGRNLVSNYLSMLGRKYNSGEGQNKNESLDIKEYIDYSLHKLETRLLDHFNQQMKELEKKQNEKFDSILALLQANNNNNG